MTVALPGESRKRTLEFGEAAEIAAALGLSRSYVSRVRNNRIVPATAEGRRQVRRVRVAIARRLRLRVDDLFPPL